MRRASFITKQLSLSQEDVDENGNTERDNDNFLSPPPFFGIPNYNRGGQGMVSSRSVSNFQSPRVGSPPSKFKEAFGGTGMSSRPSFISLMLIASDDELSRLPRLPAPLQVETDTYQKCGWDDSPKNCSHLPILNPPESDDENDSQNGILQTIIHLPERIRKISADKQRLNIYALPDQDRAQLKNLYVF